MDQDGRGGRDSQVKVLPNKNATHHLIRFHHACLGYAKLILNQKGWDV